MRITATCADSCDCNDHAQNRFLRWLGAALPIGTCAICPACLTMYAKILAVVGVGFALAEWQHALLLAIAVSVALGLGIVNARRIRRYGKLALIASGAAILVGAHLWETAHWVEWLGCAVLLAGTIGGGSRRKSATVPRYMRASSVRTHRVNVT